MNNTYVLLACTSLVVGMLGLFIKVLITGVAKWTRMEDYMKTISQDMTKVVSRLDKLEEWRLNNAIQDRERWRGLPRDKRGNGG